MTNREDAVQFSSPDGVYEPTNRTNPPLGAVPADLAAWLRGNKWLDLSRRSVFRLAVSPAQELLNQKGTATVPVRLTSVPCAVRAPFGPPSVSAAGCTFYPGDQAVFEVLRAHKQPLVIWIVGPSAGYSGSCTSHDKQWHRSDSGSQAEPRLHRLGYVVTPPRRGSSPTATASSWRTRAWR